MTLGAFLQVAGADRAPWNCSTLAADWCVALGYPDFAAPWRDVTGEDECEEAAAGGLVLLWDEGIGDRLARASQPLQPGDIAVVSLGHLEAGAIWTGERFAVRASRGLHFAAPDNLTVLKAWRPTHG